MSVSIEVSLQDQCLIFIVGHLFESDKGEEGISIRLLALLPRFIRRQLLLLLPVIDVCRLENTPFTHGIAMDEIWETLYNKKFPIRDKEQAFYDGFYFYTPTEWKKEKELSCNWKESYFLSLFFSFCDRNWATHCGCDCGCDKPDHFPTDLLYGVCDYYPPTYFYNFLYDGSVTVFHGIKRYSRCSAFPERYTTVYQKGFTPEIIIDTLVDVCNAKLKHLTVRFSASGVYIGLKDYNCVKINDKVRQQKLSQLFSLLQSLDFGVMINKPNTKIAKTFLDDLIPGSVKRALLSSFSLFNEDLEFLLSYFLKPSHCHLKCLKLATYNYHPPPSFLFDVIKHQQELESLYWNMNMDIDNLILLCITEDLFYRPVFKTFTYIGSGNQNVVFPFMKAFFASPYLELLSLKYVSDIHFHPLPIPLTIQYNEKKSWKLSNCSFPDSFLSILPPHLFLKSLELKERFDPEGDSRLVTLFSSLECIEVEVFSISSYIDANNAHIISSLFSIITAKCWKVKLEVFCLDYDKQDSVLPLVDALSIIKPGCLHYLCLQESSLQLTEDDTLAILEVLFCSLVPTADAYFELDISRLSYNKEFGKSIHDKWKECMAVSHLGVKPLKKMILSHEAEATVDALMKEMASEVDYHFKDYSNKILL